MSKFRQLRNKSLSAMAALTLTASIIVPAGAQLIPLKADAGQQLGQTNFDEGSDFRGISLNQLRLKWSSSLLTENIK